LLGHGGGGALTRALIDTLLLPRLNNPALAPLDDSAVLPAAGEPLAFTTDSYVIAPRFFPGGDIGRLAVFGTANDLAMQGAEPRWLSLGLILEEGLPLAELERVIDSVKVAATTAGLTIVTGDTKVVEHGRCDGLYINTAGIGRVLARRPLGAASVRAGDDLVVSGPLGEHGIAVLSQRPGIAFATRVVSDAAPLWPMVRDLLHSGAEVHALRDLTRGGLAAAVCDWARAASVGIRLDERAVPVGPEVRGACDLLGLDPLTIANEGKFLVSCPPGSTAAVLAALQRHPLGRQARVIGQASARPAGRVVMRTPIGGERIVDMPTGEDLPRIC